MKAAFFTIGDRQRGSSRLRVLQLLQPLEAIGVSCRTLTWDPSRFGKVRYVAEALRLARWADVVVLQKPHQPRPLVDIVRRLAPLVVDIDDAMWAPIDTTPEHVAQAREREGRLRHALAASRTVMAGSAYLQGWISDQLPDLEVRVVPPALDVSSYDVVEHGERSPVVIGWIGSPVNFGDLDVAAPALARLTEAGGAQVRVISRERPPIAGADFVRWSETTEAHELTRFDIGIMPLRDDERSRGRCGFKAVQYAAAGLPVVASNVGASSEVVDDGDTGFLADDDETWQSRLQDLIDDPSLRARLGQAGRDRAEKLYDVARAAEEVSAVLTSVAS